MAKGVYQHEVAVIVLSTLGLWFLMMHMQFFVIAERAFADRAYPILLPGDFLSPGWEIFDFHRVSLVPIVFERGVIWGRRSLHQDVPFNGKPCILEEVVTCLLVAKHPMVLSLKVEPAPIFALLPLLGCGWVGSLDLPHFFVKHPIVKLVKGLFGSSWSVIVRPTANNGVQFPQDFPNGPSTYCLPFLSHLLSVFLNSLLAWLGEQLPSCFRV